MAYKIRLLDQTRAFHIYMPYLMGNIRASLILNYGWLYVIKYEIVGDISGIVLSSFSRQLEINVNLYY